MSHKAEPKPCSICRRVRRLKAKDMCSGCYLRDWRGGGFIKATARCVGCNEQDRRLLRHKILTTGASVVTCYNCGQLADKMRPRPSSIQDIKRERRGAQP